MYALLCIYILRAIVQCIAIRNTLKSCIWQKTYKLQFVDYCNMLKKRCYRRSRSQVSLFIILGILILVFVALYYATVIPAIENMKENSVKPYDNTVESFMEYCMDHKTDQIFSCNRPDWRNAFMLIILIQRFVSKDTLKTKEQIKQDIILLTNFMINECIEENPFSC